MKHENTQETNKKHKKASFDYIDVYTTHVSDSPVTENLSHAPLGERCRQRVKLWFRSHEKIKSCTY